MTRILEEEEVTAELLVKLAVLQTTMQDFCANRKHFLASLGCSVTTMLWNDMTLGQNINSKYLLVILTGLFLVCMSSISLFSNTTRAVNCWNSACDVMHGPSVNITINNL